ncbi:MAG TPA: ROK family protein [Saprospiraceae bacterium]|nr:ROK family protein [Saprospiraceae bacterium]
MGKKVLGIDVGASAVKGGIVDLGKGEMISERFKIKTASPPAPMKEVVDAFAKIVEHFDWKGEIGIGFPSLVKNHVIYTASNVDKAWIGQDIQKVFGGRVGLPVFAVNDADAAGLAERAFGGGQGKQGTVLLLTLGTGIGSALFRNGVLIPNTELGHLKFKGDIAEKYCSSRIKEIENLSMKKWGGRLNNYLKHLDRLFSPDLILIGGGISRKFDKFKDYLTVDVEVRPAAMKNIAGIVGAAMAVNV